MSCTRRAFVSGLTLAGTAGLLGVRPDTTDAEPPPETTRLRLVKSRTLCWAPQYLAEGFLRAEGFSEVSYVPVDRGRMMPLLAEGRADLGMEFVGPAIISLDEGLPALFLAGLHIGCFEVFGSGSVQRIGDLKGRTVAVAALNGSQHVFLASIVAYVAGPEKGHYLARHPAGGINPTTRRGNHRCHPRFSPRSPGVAGEKDRPRRAQQHHRPAVVPVLLLRPDGCTRVCAQAPISTRPRCR